MTEIKKFGYYKAALVFLLVVIAGVTAYFFYDMRPQETDVYEDIWLPVKEERTVQEILEECDHMTMFSVFTQKDSFSYRNIEKTRVDYQKIAQVQTEALQTDFWNRFFQADWIGAVLGMLGILIVAVYTENRKQGFSFMLHACPYGRGRRNLYRLFALMVHCGLLVWLQYGLIIAAGLVTGFTSLRELGLALQSVEVCSLIPVNCTIGAYVIRTLLMKCMFLSVAAGTLWCVFVVMEQLVLGLGISGILLAAGMALNWWVSAHSVFGVLKFSNLWYFLFSNSCFYEYLNLNLGGIPVGRVGYLIVLCSVWMLLLYGIAYVKGEGLPGSLTLPKGIPLSIGTDAVGRRGGSELYKSLWLQKGLMVMGVLLLFYIRTTDGTHVMRTGYQDMYYAFMEQHEGVPSAEAREEIRELGQWLDDLEQELVQAGIDYDNGTLSEAEYGGVLERYARAENDRIFRTMITEQTAYLDELAANEGITAWYVNQYGYRHLWVADFGMKEGLLLFSVLLLSFGMIWIETGSGMLSVINSCYRNLDSLFRKKWLALGGEIAVLYAAVQWIQWSAVSKVYGIYGLNAPLQSLQDYSNVPLRMTIWQFAALYYTGMVLLIFTVGTLILYSSGKLLTRKN